MIRVSGININFGFFVRMKCFQKEKLSSTFKFVIFSILGLNRFVRGRAQPKVVLCF